ncbi:TOMM precursor leader peptide-binding protein [Spiractinospora alimapuensis]|uniref:TOMM precursor leader peptide-binding protein n=1 Tax=Spiractinospora alimapuensis TaxID=2820884 RepID=UPI001F3B99A1|nr:TOMM precursor leader peptide-binding protein [Spiractinospora alimapuensis]QVQ50237.1 TOMM precursor leader peptide-binding protein [Spiractinospora alimapuensis]
MPKESPHILFLTSGDFGHEVAGRLGANHTSSILETSRGTHSSAWPAADLIVTATHTEVTRLAEHVDAAAFNWNVPWFSIHLTYRDVRCGPVVRPGRSACHWCFRRRREQHSADGGPTDDDRTTPLPEFAYPAHAVGVAVGFGHQAVAEAMGGSPEGALGGTVRAFSLVDGSTSKASVLAVDRCPRCRPDRGSPALWDRFATIRTADDDRKPAFSGGTHG